jgi:transcriptional regulator with XRE-family HTH domain
MPNHKSREIGGAPQHALMASTLKALRSIAGFTQLELARAAGIEKSLMWRFESGHSMPSREQRIILSQSLGFPARYLERAATASLLEGERAKNPKLDIQLSTVFEAEVNETGDQPNLVDTLTRLSEAWEHPAKKQKVATSVPAAPVRAARKPTTGVRID